MLSFQQKMCARTALLLGTFVLLFGETLSHAQGAQRSTGVSSTDSARTKPPAATSNKFEPAGKSFTDLILENKRAFAAGDYERMISLMNQALRLNINPQQAAGALNNRGVAYALTEEPDRAIKDFDEALKFNPRFASAYLARALALLKENELDDALKDFNQAIEVDPQQWQAYDGRAQLFILRCEWSYALKDIEKEIQINPKTSSGYAKRAAIHLRHREYTKAIADADKAISLEHNAVDARIARANARIRLKQYSEAERDLYTIPELKAIVRGGQFNNLAWIRATCLDPKIRNGKEAVKLALKASKLSKSKNWEHLDTLAAAYAEAGDFDSAIKYQQQTLSLVENSPPPNEAELRERLALYQKHQPYRDQLKP